MFYKHFDDWLSFYILSVRSWSALRCKLLLSVIRLNGKYQPVVKQNLLFAHCYSLYGSVLWDLDNRCLDSVCTTEKVLALKHRPW